MQSAHKSRRRWIFAAGGLVLVVAAAAGYITLSGASVDVDPSKLVTVERGTMVKSVVATGKIEPITKVEIKSKANGIIEHLAVDVDQIVQAGDVLAELDKEQLRAHVRELEASLEAKRAALTAADAQLRKNRIEAESPDVELAKRNYDRASTLFSQRLIAQSGLDDAKSALDVATNRQRAAQGQLIISEAH